MTYCIIFALILHKDIQARKNSKMQFATIPCHKDLQPFIRNYWLLRAYCKKEGTQRIFSNGATSLHFYLGQGVRLDNEEREYQTALNHHSMKCMEIHTTKGRLEILGVEFVPFCSHLFFSLDSDTTHATTSEINNIEFTKLEESIHATNDVDRQTALLDEFFCKQLNELDFDETNIERLQNVFEGIVTSEEKEEMNNNYKTISTVDLAIEAHIGQKQFTRIFSKYVGLRPKAYLRLLRFHKALREIQQMPKDTLLKNIAWKCGYSDTAHMTNDFKQLCGHTPTEIISIRSILTEAFSPNFSDRMKKKVLLENII